ncbi:MAG: hypothetical protein ACNYZG_03730 [Gammaproteobacteria bacterium]
MDTIPFIQRVVAILWPSFITAGIATVLFTTAFDPAFIFSDYDISRLGVYTICFFMFWSLGAITSAATCYFLKPCATINKISQDKAKKPAEEQGAAVKE